MSNLPFNPTPSQAELIDRLSAFMVSRDPRRCFILRGYAGTGKTSVVGALVRAMSGLRIPSALLAPTGRAAKVMSHYSGMPAYTIHKAIYRQDPTTGRFSLTQNNLQRGIVIVDEASMLASTREFGENVFGSGCLLDDLIRWVYSIPRCYLILVGDDAQLPPVGQKDSLALSADFMAGYDLNIHEHVLTDVARQALDSGILSNATALRSDSSSHNLPSASYNQLSATHNLQSAAFIPQFAADFVRLDPQQVSEMLERSYRDVGADETIILTRSNIRTNIYNNGVRSRILWKEELLSASDRIMVSHNNYSPSTESDDISFIANGEMLEIKRLRNEREMYGFHFVDAELIGLDQPYEICRTLWIDTLTTDSPEDNYKMQQTLFQRIAEDYPEIHNQRELTRRVKESPYYNALQVRYAYAVTCHKAQGGQWRHVYIDVPPREVTSAQTGETRSINPQEYNRWLYTAITRATERVYWIAPQEKAEGKNQ